MNILLWVLQALLSLHTAVGAVWKFSHSPEQTMPSLRAIPNSAWLVMGIFELLCSLALILPAFGKSLTILAPIAAAFISAEMLLFCGLHFSSGALDLGPIFYWLTVAVFCGVIIYGRLALK